MKINKKNFSLVGLIILFSLAYLLLATKPARNSLQLEPQWTIEVNEEAVVASSSQGRPFKMGQIMGYYTAEGTVSSFQVLEERGSISSNYYAPFSSNASQTPFFTADGMQSGILEKAGFPFFEKNRIFLFAPTGNSFSAYNTDGNETWFHEGYAPITAFFSNEAGIVVGYADGKVIVFDLEGNVRQEFYPGGSEYEVIFGASLSQSGRYVACLSGLDLQRIVISDIAGNTSKIIFHEYIEEAVLEQSLVYFSENEEYVFANVKDSLVVVNLDDKKSQQLAILGKVVAIKEIHAGDYYFILSKDREVSTVTIFNSNMYKVGSFSYEEKNSFIDSDGEYVYIGNGTTISKMFVK